MDIENANKMLLLTKSYKNSYFISIWVIFLHWFSTQKHLFYEQKWENPTIVYCREEPRSSAVHPLLHFFTLPNSSQLTLVIFKIQTFDLIGYSWLCLMKWVPKLWMKKIFSSVTWFKTKIMDGEIWNSKLKCPLDMLLVFWIFFWNFV